jgi:hypothetical protein
MIGNLATVIIYLWIIAIVGGGAAIAYRVVNGEWPQ